MNIWYSDGGRKLFRSFLFLWVALTWLLAVLPSGAAQLGTAFHYQGRLSFSNAPANGPHDFEFAAYAESVGGVPVAPVQTNLAIGLSNGVFNAVLDFGMTVGTSEARWLEVRVRPTPYAGPLSVLSPRQPLLAVPTSLYARTADQASTATSAAVATNVATEYWSLAATNSDFSLAVRTVAQTPAFWSGMSTNPGFAAAAREAVTGTNVFYVSPEMGFVAISNVFQRMPAGSTVVFLPGTYHVAAGLRKGPGFGDSDFPAPFKLVRKHGARVIGLGQVSIVPTNGAGDIFLVSDSHNVVFENLEVRWPSVPFTDIFCAAISLINTNYGGTVRNVRVFNYPNHGINQIHGPYRGSTNWLVERCYFENGGQLNWTGITNLVDGAAVQADEAWVVRSCTFRDVYRGIEVQNNAGNGTANNVLVTDNLFIDLREFGIGSFTADNGDQLIIANNRFVQQRDAITSGGLFTYGVFLQLGRRVTISGNKFDGPLVACVTVGGYETRSVVISGNHFTDCYNGVYFSSTDNGLPLDHCLVTGNIFTRCRTRGLGGDPASLLLTDNWFDSCGGQYSVEFSRSTSTNVIRLILVERNVFEEARRPSSVLAGVFINKDFSNVVVRANHLVSVPRVANDTSGRSVVVGWEGVPWNLVGSAPGMDEAVTNGPVRAWLSTSLQLRPAASGTAKAEVVIWERNGTVRRMGTVSVGNGDQPATVPIMVPLNPGAVFAITNLSTTGASVAIVTNTWTLVQP